MPLQIVTQTLNGLEAQLWGAANSYREIAAGLEITNSSLATAANGILELTLDENGRSTVTEGMDLAAPEHTALKGFAELHIMASSAQAQKVKELSEIQAGVDELFTDRLVRVGMRDGSRLNAEHGFDNHDTPSFLGLYSKRRVSGAVNDIDLRKNTGLVAWTLLMTSQYARFPLLDKEGNLAIHIEDRTK